MRTRGVATVVGRLLAVLMVMVFAGARAVAADCTGSMDDSLQTTAASLKAELHEARARKKVSSLAVSRA